MKIWIVVGVMAANLIIFVVGAGLITGGAMLTIDFLTDGKGLCGETSTKQETVICKTLKD